MSDGYTIENLRKLEDVAAASGLGETQEARFAGKPLDARDTGLALQSVKPGKRQAFGHRHEKAEEVYVVLSGSGRVKLDDDIVGLKPFDAIRVAPGVARAFEGGPEGIQFLALGPHHERDAEILQDFWPAD